jgi:hypothetical protein
MLGRAAVRKALAVLAFASIALGACGGSGSSQQAHVAACKRAMDKQLSTALRNGSSGGGSEPAACKGLSARTLKKLVGEVLAHALGTASPVASPMGSAGPLDDWGQNGGTAQTDRVEHDATLRVSKPNGRRLKADATSAFNNPPPVDFAVYQEAMSWYQGAGGSMAAGHFGVASHELQHADRLLHKVKSDWLRAGGG